MIHPLHTAEFLENFKDYPGLEQRRTGRSTAQGLRLIAYAIERPHTRVNIADHHGTRLADQNLAHTMKVMVQRLELQHLHFGRLSDGRPYVVFGGDK